MAVPGCTTFTPPTGVMRSFVSHDLSRLAADSSRDAECDYCVGASGDMGVDDEQGELGTDGARIDGDTRG